MAGDAGDAVFVGLHHADKMAVRLILKMPPLHHVYLFAFLQNHGASIPQGRDEFNT